MQLFRTIVASLLGLAIQPYPRETAGMLEHKFVSVDVTLATNGATTAVTLSIPAGSIIDGVAVKVLTPVAGISADSELAFALTGGSTVELGSWLATALDEAGSIQYGFAPAFILVSGSAANGSLVISEGADNTPSAGKLRILVYYRTIRSL